MASGTATVTCKNLTRVDWAIGCVQGATGVGETVIITATSGNQFTVETIDESGVLTPDKVAVSQASADMAIDVDYTATTYVNNEGFVDIRRTGNLTSVDTETIVDVLIKPTFDITAPGMGETSTYYGVHINAADMTFTPDAGTVVASGQFVWPSSGRITQNFVWYHQGLDIANKSGPAVLAADSGTVVVSGWPVVAREIVAPAGLCSISAD